MHLAECQQMRRCMLPTCITTHCLTLILLKGTVSPYHLAQQRTTAHLTAAARQHMLSPAGALAAAPRLAVPGAPPALPPPACAAPLAACGAALAAGAAFLAFASACGK